MALPTPRPATPDHAALPAPRSELIKLGGARSGLLAAFTFAEPPHSDVDTPTRSRRAGRRLARWVQEQYRAGDDSLGRAPVSSAEAPSEEGAPAHPRVGLKVRTTTSAATSVHSFVLVDDVPASPASSAFPASGASPQATRAPPASPAAALSRALDCFRPGAPRPSAPITQSPSARAAPWSARMSPPGPSPLPPPPGPLPVTTTAPPKLAKKHSSLTVSPSSPSALTATPRGSPPAPSLFVRAASLSSADFRPSSSPPTASPLAIARAASHTPSLSPPPPSVSPPLSLSPHAPMGGFAPGGPPRPSVLGAFLHPPSPAGSTSDLGAPPGRPSFASSRTLGSSRAGTPHPPPLPPPDHDAAHLAPPAHVRMGSGPAGAAHARKPASMRHHVFAQPSLWSLPPGGTHMFDAPGAEVVLSEKPAPVLGLGGLRREEVGSVSEREGWSLGESLSRVGEVLGMGRKKRRTLVVSGIERADVGKVDGVRRWCESFGEVSQFVRVPNGDVHVHFRSAEVADTVCRIRAKVHITGVGSVGLSWYKGKHS